MCSRIWNCQKGNFLSYFFFSQAVLPYVLSLSKMIHVWDSVDVHGLCYHLRPCGCLWSVLLPKLRLCEWHVLMPKSMMMSMTHAGPEGCVYIHGLCCHQGPCWGPCLMWMSVAHASAEYKWQGSYFSHDVDGCRLTVEKEEHRRSLRQPYSHPTVTKSNSLDRKPS